MHIRHDRDMFEDKRQAGGILQLAFGVVLHRHTLGPHFDRTPLGGGDDIVILFVHDGFNPCSENLSTLKKVMTIIDEIFPELSALPTGA
jgi:hypothetical protein